MKLLAAFLKLIRWPNLVFIVITQLLFYYCVYIPLPLSHSPGIILFYLLIAASVLIAAAGYIINDYFDVQIDAINKPDKVIVDKIIKRRWAIVWHWLLSGAGVVISIYISWCTNVWIIALANFLCTVLLWVYSTTFKKKLLTGNVIIALLTAWVIIVVYFFAGTYADPGINTISFDYKKLFKLTMLYAGFAFIVSLIREVIKDLEDMEGDRKYHCRTMPIVWGVPVSKVFAGVWIAVAIATLLIVQAYAVISGWWVVAVYGFIFIILPFVFLLQRLSKAATSADYHQLSNLVKAIMLAGILSMLFFKFSS